MMLERESSVVGDEERKRERESENRGSCGKKRERLIREHDQ